MMLYKLAYMQIHSFI